MKPKKTEVVVKPDDQVEAAYNAWTSDEMSMIRIRQGSEGKLGLPQKVTFFLVNK